MGKYHKKIEGCIDIDTCEELVKELNALDKEFYTEENLKSRVAYLEDSKQGRLSKAYSIADEAYSGRLPGPDIRRLIDNYRHIYHASLLVLGSFLYTNIDNRFLINSQRYFGQSSPVPKHFDGDIMNFEATEDGVLEIQTAIRPEYVAVLTLVNDVPGAGTRLHLPDGTSEVIECKAGDLLVFDNVRCFHSVDAFNAESKREDGLVRMTIGWRSLMDRCFYQKGDQIVAVSKREVETIVNTWLMLDWPEKWREIKGKGLNGAF